MNLSLFLFVSLTNHMSELHKISLSMIPVARSSFGNVALCYVLGFVDDITFFCNGPYDM